MGCAPFEVDSKIKDKRPMTKRADWFWSYSNLNQTRRKLATDDQKNTVLISKICGH